MSKHNHREKQTRLLLMLAIAGCWFLTPSGKTEAQVDNAQADNAQVDFDVKAFCREIRSEDRASSVAAIQHAGKLSEAGYTAEDADLDLIMDALIDMLDADTADRRAESAIAIGRFGPLGAKATDELINNMLPGIVSEDARLVWNIYSETLGEIGAPALPKLIAALDNQDETIYKGVCAAMHNMAADLDDANLTELKKAIGPRMENETGLRRWSAAYAAMNVGPRGADLVPQFAMVLDDEDFRAVFTACQALAKIGPPAKEAVGKLLVLTRDGIVSERGHAAMALGAIGPVEGTEIVPDLIRLLDDPNAVVQERAIIGLGLLGTHAKAAQPLLEAKLKSKTFRQRSEAAFTLWRVSGERQPALDKLIQCINMPEHELDSIEKLGRMGGEATDAVAPLVHKLEHGDVSAQAEVCIALGRIGKSNEDVRRVLMQAIDAEDEEVRQLATKAMDQLGIE